MRGRTNVGIGGAIELPDTPLDPLNLTFTERLINTVNTLTKVIYAGGRFVAIGYKGTIAFSADGVTWIVRTIDQKYTLFDVIYVNGVYTVVGGETGEYITGHRAVIAQSTNLVDWTVVNDTYIQTETCSFYAFTGIVHDGEKYILPLLDSNRKALHVAYGSDLTALTMTNKICDTSNSFSSDCTARICYAANARYVITSDVLGKTLYSTDGIVWAQSTLTGGGNFITYINNKYIITIGKGIYLSTNGNTWNAVTKESWSNGLCIINLNDQDMCLTKDRYVNSQKYFVAADISSQSDVASAEYQYIPENLTMRYMAYGNDKIIMVGEGGVILTTDIKIRNRTLEITPSTLRQSIFLQRKDNIRNLDVKPVTSTIDANIRPENIKAGVTILGVTGTL